MLKQIEAKLNLILNSIEGSHHAQILLDAMRYSSLDGGKRIRPLLSVAASSLSDADLDVAIHVGCAVELVHCYSLVHDDLPSMDNDDWRRGRFTCHKQFGEALAILAGDSLLSLAFEMLSIDELKLAPIIKLKIINLLANLSGINGMAGGQAIDLNSVGIQINLEKLKQMHIMKTGGLIKVAVLSGYLCGNDFQEDIYIKLIDIADKLGLLFQIVDDIIDVTEDTVMLGKTANKDLLNDKATYVSILGLSTARDLALQLYNEVLILLKFIPKNIQLIEILNSIYDRTNPQKN